MTIVCSKYHPSECGKSWQAGWPHLPFLLIFWWSVDVKDLVWYMGNRGFVKSNMQNSEPKRRRICYTTKVDSAKRRHEKFDQVREGFRRTCWLELFVDMRRVITIEVNLGRACFLLWAAVSFCCLNLQRITSTWLFHVHAQRYSNAYLNTEDPFLEKSALHCTAPHRTAPHQSKS